MKNKNRMYLADFSLLIVAMLWGGTYVVVKNAFNSINLPLLLTFRFVIASTLMYLLFNKKIGKITLNDLKKGSVVGVILFLGFLFINYGLMYTEASKQGFLVASYVVIVPLLYWILYRKRPETKFFIGSILTIYGIGLITLENGFTISFGDSLTLISAIFFAMHIISIEYYAKNMNIYKLAFLQFFVCAILSVILVVFTKQLYFDFPSSTWYSIIYLSVIATLFCFSTQTIAQKYTNSSHASIIMSLESVFAAILGIVFLNEVLTPPMIFGGFLIMCAVLIIELDIKFYIKKR
ncbi:DMT family transporter [Clostridiaceae bacterium HSG29]|nr:DMT family transporter [Clostridiaceae bacterium HSG29]